VSNVISVILIVIFVICSAFFSGSEIVLATCNKIRLKKSAEAGNKAAAIIERLNENFTKTISTILVGNNLVNIASSSVATVLCLSLFGANGQAVATAGMTIILIIFGETLPKIIAAEYPDTLAPIIAYPLRICKVIFAPVVNVVSLLIGLLAKIWTPKETEPAVTAADLCTILETIEEEGVFTEREGELIKSAIEFTDVTAHDILTPRVDVLAYDIEDDLSALFANEDFLKFSRIPVYQETVDNVIGIVSTKKLMRSYLQDKHVDVRELLKEPIYVHMTRPISSILMEFRKTNSHMAIVVDEFGGMMGILTLEDILEEIVGDIYDESDDVELEYVCAGEDSFIVDGSMNIYDMFELIEVPSHNFESEYMTVGGWATEMLDRFPAEGDSFTYENVTVTVLEAQAMRVEKLKIDVSRVDEEDENEKDSDEEQKEQKED